ncbi:conserved hypothetical protein [delta proteobacterium NaphS2]|nr:conserved hypothetical protein [delta proteobacterium NaphS2]
MERFPENPGVVLGYLDREECSIWERTEGQVPDLSQYQVSAVP